MHYNHGNCCRSGVLVVNFEHTLRKVVAINIVFLFIIMSRYFCLFGVQAKLNLCFPNLNEASVTFFKSLQKMVKKFFFLVFLLVKVFQETEGRWFTPSKTNVSFKKRTVN